jgi:hypothetical protein
MDERKEFERWASDDWTSTNAVLKDADGIYKLMSVQQQWRAWQASAELGTPHCTKKLNALHVNHIALQAECEALRKDAERLNWLEQGGQWELTRLRASAKPDAMRYWMVEDFDGDDLTQETDEAERQTLRGAIDAAMGKEKA